jgi:hypothetical protein
MKKLILLLLSFVPLFMNGQKVVILSVVQPPEFGFSVSKHDTTILKGNSIVLGNDLVVFGGSGSYSYKWSPNTALNNSIILHPVASPIDTTTYTLTVTDKNGCSFSVNYTVNVKTPNVSSELIVAQPNLNAILFPNPNEGSFKVILTGKSTKKIELIVIDKAGKELKRQTIRNFTGDQTEILQLHLVSGIYTLRIHSERETLSRQFIIH